MLKGQFMDLLDVQTQGPGSLGSYVRFTEGRIGCGVTKTGLGVHTYHLALASYAAPGSTLIIAIELIPGSEALQDRDAILALLPRTASPAERTRVWDALTSGRREVPQETPKVTPRQALTPPCTPLSVILPGRFTAPAPARLPIRSGLHESADGCWNCGSPTVESTWRYTCLPCGVDGNTQATSKPRDCYALPGATHEVKRVDGSYEKLPYTDFGDPKVSAMSSPA